MHVPDGWNEEKLGDLFEFKNGANTEAANYGSGIKFVNVLDIFGNNILTCEKIKESVNLPANKADLYRLKMGDVLFNRTSETFDEIALSSVYLDSKFAIFGGFVIRGRPVSKSLNHQFCVYCFSSSNVRKELIRRGQGAIRANIGQTDLRHIPLLVPPLPEQQKIAQILSTWDKAIEKQEALIAAKQKRKKALMQQLLTGKKRFAGFEGKWKIYHLGELFSERNESGYNDLNLLSITREKGVIPRDAVERKDTSNDDKSKYLRICPGDIGYNTMRMWQGVSALSELEGIVSPAYTICIPKNHIAGKYTAFLFKTPVVMNLFLRFSQGLTSDTWNLKFRHFSEIKITIPERSEQQKIASVLSAADSEIETHQKQLAALKEQKKGLMQQLLTGKKRVKVDEAAA